jgi:hypothetical protein
MSYERFFEWIVNFKDIWKFFKLKRIPHFTTLNKFVKRFPKRYLDELIFISGNRDVERKAITAIDSTGFSLTNASYYYTAVIKTRKSRKKKRRKIGNKNTRAIKKYLKTTFIVDVETQMVYSVSIRRGPSNDNKDFKRSYRRLEKHRGFVIGTILADRGYDSEANHEYAHDIWKAKSIIPTRKNRSKDFKTRGQYRKQMKKGYNRNLYYRRNMVETVNSVLKRTMGGLIRARTILNQNREVLFMVIAYNINKNQTINFWVLIGFLDCRFFREPISPNPLSFQRS